MELIDDTSTSVLSRYRTNKLATDMKGIQYVGNVYHPQISVENHTYRGDMSNVNNLFKELCRIVLDTDAHPRPDQCHQASITENHDPA